MTPHPDQEAIGARHKWRARILTAALLLIAGLHPLSIWSFGFEVADSGWAALLSRDFVARPDLIAPAAPWYLTWGIGYFAGKLSDQPIWLTLRQVGFVPYSLSALAAFLISRTHGVARPEAAAGILAASLLSYAGFSAYQLTYNSLSAALSCLSIGAAIISRECVGNRERLLLLAAGSLTSLAAASRLPSVLTVIPIVFYLIARGERSPARATLVFLLGLLIGVGAVAAIASVSGNSEQYLSGLYEFLSKSGSADGSTSHAALSVASSWLLTFGRTLAYALGVAVALFALARVSQGRLVQSRRFAMLPLGVLTLLAIRHEELLNCLPLVAILMALLGQRLTPAVFTSRPMLVVAAGTLFAITFSIGSLNGFKNSLMAYWLVFPFLLEVASVRERRSLVLLVLCAIALTSIYREIHPYWDWRIDALRCRFSIESVQGVRSNCDRVAEVEEIAGVVAANSAQTDRILVAQNSPGLYVLTDRSVWGRYPWPYLISPEEVGESLADPLRDYPALVILDKVNMFTGAWPGSGSGAPVEHLSGRKEHFPIYLRFLEQHGYALIFENRTWSVFSREPPLTRTSAPPR